MTNNHRVIFCAIIFLLTFLVVGFFCPAPDGIFALEVQYPTIAGQNINADANLTLPSYIKYLFNAGMFLGFFAVFLSLVIAGVMYFLSPIKADLVSSARDRISGAISGLLILALTYLIITTVNPQLVLVSSSKLPVMTCDSSQHCVSGGTGKSCFKDSDCMPRQAPSVYFYRDPSDCPGKNVSINATSNILDFDSLKNLIKSVNVVKDSQTKTSYVSILYNNPGLWGRCQYINGDTPCQIVGPFASSASIYPYAFNPSGDGVYFYRKSCFNSKPINNITGIVSYCNANSGGYYKVPNASIKGIYIEKLENLQFQGVPQAEQDCIKYDAKGNCTSRSPQNLGGENISSVIINGNYLVLFVYFGPDDEEYGPWTYCQEFPAPDDINKIGPRQIKWQSIRSDNSKIPNYVVIFPIEKY